MEKEYAKLDWPKEAVLELIKMWETYQCLYNPKDRCYHNKHARYAACNQIAKALKVFNPAMGPTDIKNKMTYLRGQYTREVSKTKEKKSGPGAEDIYVPAAYWYAELSFLNDFIKTRKGGCNFYDDNSGHTADSLDTTFLLKSEISPTQPSKRSRLTSETPQTSHKITQEDTHLTAATSVPPNIAANNKKAEVDVRVNAFCDYIKAELSAMTNSNIKDELMELITQAVFDAKKKYRMSQEMNLNIHDFN